MNTPSSQRSFFAQSFARLVVESVEWREAGNNDAMHTQALNIHNRAAARALGASEWRKAVQDAQPLINQGLDALPLAHEMKRFPKHHF